MIEKLDFVAAFVSALGSGLIAGSSWLSRLS